MYQRHKDRASFVFVYVSEAHAADGWQMPPNVKDRVIYDQPRSGKERAAVAGACCADLKITIPCVVDGIDNRVDALYAGWPERMFVIGADGRIVYAGGQGPWGFDPVAVEKALESLR